MDRYHCTTNKRGRPQYYRNGRSIRAAEARHLMPGCDWETSQPSQQQYRQPPRRSQACSQTQQQYYPPSPSHTRITAGPIGGPYRVLDAMHPLMLPQMLPSNVFFANTCDDTALTAAADGYITSTCDDPKSTDCFKRTEAMAQYGCKDLNAYVNCRSRCEGTPSMCHRTCDLDACNDGMLTKLADRYVRASCADPTSTDCFKKTEAMAQYNCKSLQQYATCRARCQNTPAECHRTCDLEACDDVALTAAAEKYVMAACDDPKSTDCFKKLEAMSQYDCTSLQQYGNCQKKCQGTPSECHHTCDIYQRMMPRRDLR